MGTSTKMNVPLLLVGAVCLYCCCHSSAAQDTASALNGSAILDDRSSYHGRRPTRPSPPSAPRNPGYHQDSSHNIHLSGHHTSHQSGHQTSHQNSYQNSHQNSHQSSFEGGSYGGHPEHKHGSKLKEEYGWKFIDYEYRTQQDRQNAIRSGAYDRTKIIPLDMDVWEKGHVRKMFVTMPTGPGIPVSLATVTNEGDRHSPLLAPYPDWSWHQRGNCDSITSVYRVAVDDLDRLWVLDRGDDSCSAQLLSFDLNTDRLLSRYRFPRDLLKANSTLITPAVDVRNGGQETFVYIADVQGYMLLVYDHQNQRAWRVEHPLFAAEPEFGRFDIAGSQFTLLDGVFGLALGPLRNGDRLLFFHSLASRHENWVQTSVLRNRRNYRSGSNKAARDFKRSEESRSSQSAAEAMTSDGVLFSSLLSPMSITCWDSDSPFGRGNTEVVAQDPVTLQFPSGMKLRYGRLWVFTCKYQRFATNTMDWNDINYRVLSARVDDLVRGTKCDVKRRNVIG